MSRQPREPLLRVLRRYSNCKHAGGHLRSIKLIEEIAKHVNGHYYSVAYLENSRTASC